MTDVKDSIKKHSDENVDTYILTNSFKEEVAEAIRGHIHMRLRSWMFFRKMGADCCRANVALHGFGAYWRRAAMECLADANYLEAYLVQRGGACRPADIPAPKAQWPDSPVDPVQPVHEALQVEKALLEDAQRLCGQAQRCGDFALHDVVAERLLGRGTRRLKDTGDLLQQCVRVSKAPGHGVYHIDKELRATAGAMPWSHMNEPCMADRMFQRAAEDVCKNYQPNMADKMLQKTTEQFYNVSV